MAHGIFYAMYESKEIRFCWDIYVSTETNGKIFNIVAVLDCSVHVATNTVVEGPSILVINLFQLFSNKRCSHKKVLFQWISTGKCDF